jgi:streptothricin hydrolase
MVGEALQALTTIPADDKPETGLHDGVVIADAVVVVDLQREFVSGAHALPDADRLVRAVDGMVVRARTAGALVVWLRNDELHLPVLDSDVVLDKSQDDGFDGTGLADVLRAHQTRTVVVCGLLSEMCVSATARSALRLGFHVLLPHDAHATADIPDEPPIPARVVARVAEWALGDEIQIVPRAADVEFSRAGSRPT